MNPRTGEPDDCRRASQKTTAMWKVVLVLCAAWLAGFTTAFVVWIASSAFAYAMSGREVVI